MASVSNSVTHTLTPILPAFLSLFFSSFPNHPMDNLAPQFTCEDCGRPFSSIMALCGHMRIHPRRPGQRRRRVRERMQFVMVVQAVVMVAQENARPAAIFDLNETPDLMEEQENGGLPDLNVVPAVMVEAQGNGRVPDLNMLPEPEDDQV